MNRDVRAKMIRVAIVTRGTLTRTRTSHTGASMIRDVRTRALTRVLGVDACRLWLTLRAVVTACARLLFAGIKSACGWSEGVSVLPGSLYYVRVRIENRARDCKGAPRVPPGCARRPTWFLAR